MQVDVDPRPGGIAVVFADIFLGKIVKIVLADVAHALQVVRSKIMPLSYMLMAAANVLLLAEAQGLVVEVADVIVEVEEAMNKEGPLDGKHRHQHVQGHRRQAVPDVLFQFQMQKCIICSIYMYKSDDGHNHQTIRSNHQC